MGIEQVAIDQSEVFGTRRVEEEGGSTGRKIVVANDLMVGAKQPVSEIATNESSTARHKKTQQPSISAPRGTLKIDRYDY